MSKATVSVVLVLPRIRVGLPRAVDSRSTPVRARTYLRRRTWRGAIVARRMRASTSPAPARLTLAAGPASGPAAPGMTSLTRCTAARGTCKWDLRGRADGCHLTDTSACATGGRASFCLVSPIWAYIQLRPQPARAAVFIRTDSRSELACDAFRFGCCCTLLLYETREPYDQIFELWALKLVWSYGDSNPRPLACHTVATRPQKYICAGHCLGTSASVPPNPGLLLYFRAYSPELLPAQAERTGSREAHAGHSTGLYLPATRDRRRERPNSPATSARYRPLEKRTAGRRKPADPAHVTTLRTSKRPPVAPSGTG